VAIFDHALLSKIPAGDGEDFVSNLKPPYWAVFWFYEPITESP
jgi:hypothetical protein